MPSIKPVSNVLLTTLKKKYAKVQLPQQRVHNQFNDIKTRKFTDDPFADDDDIIIKPTTSSDSGWTFCGDIELGCIPLLSF